MGYFCVAVFVYCCPCARCWGIHYFIDIDIKLTIDFLLRVVNDFEQNKFKWIFEKQGYSDWTRDFVLTLWSLISKCTSANLIWQFELKYLTKQNNSPKPPWPFGLYDGITGWGKTGCKNRTIDDEGIKEQNICT